MNTYRASRLLFPYLHITAELTSKAQLQIFEPGLTKLGAKVAVNELPPKTTHIVAPTGTDLGQLATALKNLKRSTSQHSPLKKAKGKSGSKVHLSHAQGALCVSHEWVSACLKDKSHASEEPYKLKSAGGGGSKGSSLTKRRKRKKSGGDDDGKEGSSAGTGGPSVREKAEAIPKYECQRIMTLAMEGTYPGFVKEMQILESHFRAKGDPMRARTYMKAASLFRYVDFEISGASEAKYLPGVSSSLAAKFEEWQVTGRVSEAQAAEQNEESQTVQHFTKVLWAGPAVAKKWYYERNCRTLDDVLERGDPTDIQRYGIQHFEDLTEALPRREGVAFERAIGRELAAIDPKAVLLLCGGFRRGKQTGHDVDILMTHPDRDGEVGLLPKLLTRLEEKGMIVKTLSKHVNDGPAKITGPDLSGSSGAFSEPYDKWLGIATLPESLDAQGGGNNGKVRRVDLLMIPRYVWAYAVLGWTGSSLFERAIKDYAAKEKSYRLASTGMAHRDTGKLIEANSEQDIFKALGLEYIEPFERNC
eukprot:Clim_evm60s236 gene=Clim_evmTU60s236